MMTIGFRDSAFDLAAHEARATESQLGDIEDEPDRAPLDGGDLFVAIVVALCVVAMAALSRL